MTVLAPVCVEALSSHGSTIVFPARRDQPNDRDSVEQVVVDDDASHKQSGTMALRGPVSIPKNKNHQGLLDSLVGGLRFHGQEVAP